MDATTANRKRPAADIAGEESAATVDEVSDAEVEEFYAILRRMRDASRRLCGAGARAPARAPAWRPSFAWEDFAPAPPAQLPPDGERVTQDDATAPPRPGLDLNVEPEPDTPFGAGPGHPALGALAHARATDTAEEARTGAYISACVSIRSGGGDSLLTPSMACRAPLTDQPTLSVCAIRRLSSPFLLRANR